MCAAGWKRWPNAVGYICEWLKTLRFLRKTAVLRGFVEDSVIW
jgi:hypothetical protein